MNRNVMMKIMRLLLCMVLIAAMALTAVGCGSSTAPATEPEVTEAETTAPETTAPETEATETEAPETEAAGKSFTFVVTDLEGNETTFSITTEKETVGEALLDEGLIAGSDSEYGLYVTTVNGMDADWDKDQTYWAFYIDGEYAMTGVDSTEVTDGATYSFVLTKG